MTLSQSSTEKSRYGIHFPFRTPPERIISERANTLTRSDERKELCPSDALENCRLFLGKHVMRHKSSEEIISSEQGRSPDLANKEKFTCLQCRKPKRKVDHPHLLAELHESRHRTSSTNRIVSFTALYTNEGKADGSGVAPYKEFDTRHGEFKHDSIATKTAGDAERDGTPRLTCHAKQFESQSKHLYNLPEYSQVNYSHQQSHLSQKHPPSRIATAHGRKTALKMPSSPIKSPRSFDRTFPRLRDDVPLGDEQLRAETRFLFASSEWDKQPEPQDLSLSSSTLKPQYEEVEGVRLDAQPYRELELLARLSILEIEARDMRLIPAIDTSVENKDEQRLVQYRPHYAEPPPPIGAPESYVRAISPRPSYAGRDLILLEGSPRAATFEHPDEQAHRPLHNPNQTGAITSGGAIDGLPHSVSRKREASDGNAERVVVGTYASPHEPDANVIGRYQRAKGLIGGMIKTLSSSSSNQRTDKSIEDSHAGGARFLTSTSRYHDQFSFPKKDSTGVSGIEAYLQSRDDDDDDDDEDDNDYEDNSRPKI